MSILRDLSGQRRGGNKAGIASCCSANEYVLRTVLRYAARNNAPVLIEATANQVNQYGGYTGMRPSDFYDYVHSLAREEGTDASLVILGGDHLGPLVWRQEGADAAMLKAEELVAAYVAAGFEKIHLDTSMPLGNETARDGFGPALVASRSAQLYTVAERARQQGECAVRPLYVVGSEVPIPGGAMSGESVSVTSAQAFLSEMQLFKDAYARAGSDFSPVIAFVVQPGVEFSNETIHAYDSTEAQTLVQAGAKYPQLVFEGHSTDYQPAERLKEMVRDGIAILKVGPALTFAMREGLFALELIAREMSPQDAPAFRNVLLRAMLDNPVYWRSHYHGTASVLEYELCYGLSDRCRYYMSEASVKDAAEALLHFFDGKDIPYALLRQYLPIQAEHVWDGKIEKEARTLLYDKIEEIWINYQLATGRVESMAGD